MAEKKQEKKEEEKKMIDLTKVSIPQIDGSVIVRDFSKEIASVTYNQTQDLEVVHACFKLFEDGKCAWSEKVKAEFVNTAMGLCTIIGDQQIPFGIVIKQAIVDAIG